MPNINLKLELRRAELEKPALNAADVKVSPTESAPVTAAMRRHKRYRLNGVPSAVLKRVRNREVDKSAEPCSTGVSISAPSSAGLPAPPAAPVLARSAPFGRLNHLADQERLWQARLLPLRHILLVVILQEGRRTPR